MGWSDPMIFDGMPLIENHGLSKEPVQEKRTWKDRLFSWPWRPWQKTRMVVNVFIINDEIHGHPDVIAKIKQGI